MDKIIKGWICKDGYDHILDDKGKVKWMNGTYGIFTGVTVRKFKKNAGKNPIKVVITIKPQTNK